MSRNLRNSSLTEARDLLLPHRQGLSAFDDSRLVAQAVAIVALTGSDDAVTEILVHGFFGGSRERFEEHIAPQLVLMDGGSFEMGSVGEEPTHFCGESPRHRVQLSPCGIARHAVTNELFSIFDRTRVDLPLRNRHKPVVGVTWLEAFIFALWMGCRLPTEAEWEFACGAGAVSEWCCADERELSRYAWHSENARGEVRPVGTRWPNALGLFDLHGNVWEWCLDTYDADYFRSSPSLDPVCVGPDWPGDPRGIRHNVCRGGSVHSLSEMCRTRYRFHEPADFSAADLGFRVAAAVTTTEGGDSA